jgi:biofilm PGA synthesis lipoprotein PgaB
MNLTVTRHRILVFLLACLSSVGGVSRAADEQPSPQPTSDTAVVFMYHHFGVDKYPETNVTLAQFEAHIDYLEQHDYTVWPLEDIISALEQGRKLPPRTVAITIDDAYTSVYTEAWPRLRARHWPFTVFVSTDVIDQHLAAFMSWDQMREMHDAGVTFANHSSRHDHMIRRQAGEDRQQWLTRAGNDIEHAQQRLQQELGTAPKLFAYPYGEYNLALKTLIQKLGYTAFTQQSGAIALYPYTDRQLLPRFPMADHYADLDQFETKAATLALPVISAEPEEPLTTDTRPTLTVTLDDTRINAAQRQQLRCYVTGQGQTPVRWLDERRFAVTARLPLAAGRDRYNCTAPSDQDQRYFWFSRLWIIADGDD